MFNPRGAIMTRLHTWMALILFAGCALAADDKERSFKFGKDDLGKVPKGWTVDRTGKGDGSVWKVAADDTAPSRSGFALAQTAKSPRAMFNLCVVDDTSFQDLSLSVAYKAISGEDDKGGGLAWRYKDANNYYVTRYNPIERNLRLYKVVDGKREQLATEEKIRVADDEWHRIAVKHVGEQIEVSLDGKKILEAKDKTFEKAGKVGVWTKADAETRFDDLKVAAAK